MSAASMLQDFLRWFDSEAAADGVSDNTEFRWFRCLPFVFLHLACLGAIWTGVSTVAVAVCLAMFWLRMFAITAFYHRYFAHRSFKANRFWQFIFAILGNSAAQRGPLWWAAHHRKHHQHSDKESDLHSPVHRGFWWSHIGWFSCDAGFRTDYSRIKDFARFPELRWLNRYDAFVPAMTAVMMFGLGELIAALHPASGTNGWQMLVWGFFVSTVLLFHSTVTINSLGHIWGNKRFDTEDQSRNNFFLAFVTLGEGWHNNHHRWAVSARQGFYWWEVDITYYVLKAMSWVGIVRDLNPVPAKVLAEGRRQSVKESS